MNTEDPVIGTGFGFPLKVNAKGGLDWSSGPERIQNAIWIILSTMTGERVMRPDFGAGMHSFVFEPVSAATCARLADALTHALARWEPRIDLEAVTVSPSPDEASSVLVSIDYRLRSTNELFNLVYPFYVSEGTG
jgi:phage baseplate assembly protein W